MISSNARNSFKKYLQQKLRTLERVGSLTIVVFGLAAFNVLGAEPGELEKKQAASAVRNNFRGVSSEAIYTGEFWANTRGGLKREKTYLSNLDLTITIDSEEAGLWKNGKFFLYILHNSGGEKLSSSIVGDLQTISNIEAPRTTRLYEFWYEHVFFHEKFSVLTGIHDYNSEFAITEYGGLYINSSFGISAELAAGGRPSIFPLAAPGLRLKFSPCENWDFLVGAYDGDPGDPDINEHIPGSTFSSDQGIFFASEIIYRLVDPQGSIRPNLTARLGMWKNTGEFVNLRDTDANGDPITRDGNYGGYLIFDVSIYRERDDSMQGLGAFFQFGTAPSALNEVDVYLGGGFNYLGLVPGRNRDELGMAVAHASISDKLVEVGDRDYAETTLELTYRIVLNDRIVLQPDLQFVFNPGADPAVNNATVVGLRAEVIF